MTQSGRSPKLGEVYMVEFTGTGSEQLGRRPAVVFQNNIGNQRSPNLIVLPLTSSMKKLKMPTHVVLPASVGLPKDSVVLCENPVTVSKARIGSYVTTVPPDYMREIANGFVLATSATVFLEYEDFLSTQEKGIRMNGRVSA